MGLRGDVTPVVNSSGTFPILINATATVYTKAFQLKHGQSFGLWYKSTSVAGTPKFSIQLEQSYIAPTTEGSSDTNYVIGSGVADIEAALNDEIAHVKTITPVAMKWARFKIIGDALNPADSLLTIYVFQQELVS